jgi:alanyl-tRNA synthetase
MLGNWSFGDYYKKEAISWAWELLTKVWGLPKDKLYATVHYTDKEAEELWPKVTEIAPERVLQFGDKDNFWEMGDTGPCGPCTEIHIDLGPDHCDKQHVPGHMCAVNGDCARYIELWNLVFIQYDRQPDGKLQDLPAKHVDTGMGFERIVAVLQGKDSNYDTDLFVPLIRRIAELAGADERKPEHQVALRVIADHVRSLTFAIADGALPSNEGRGYVLRRILRRAARFARNLGVKEPLLYKVVPTLVEMMGDTYPELKEKEIHCQQVILAEEEAFGRTLDKGLELFAELTERLKKNRQTVIPGDEAFRLYDTYGFPLDLTQLMAEELGMTVEVEDFNKFMEEQRERARASGRFAMAEKSRDWEIISDSDHSQFLGYEYLRSAAKLCQWNEDENFYKLVFDQTPFYAESGGQVGDTGLLQADGEEFPVVNTVKDHDRIIHLVPKEKAFPIKAKEFYLEVDSDRRRRTAANHTATHLLQAVLRKNFGSHLHQAGSLVAPDRLRFDFTHYERLTAEQLEKVEMEINELIAAALPVWTEWMDYTSAIERGAMAFFGEKYGDQVRLVQIGEESLELCGGTHARNSSELLCFRVLSEGSVATGVRRIEAATGKAALELMRTERGILRQVAETLRVEPEAIGKRLNELLEEQARLKKAWEELEREKALAEADKALEKLKDVGGARYLVARIDDLPLEMLRENVDRYKNKFQSCVVLLGTVHDDKVSFVAGVTPDLTKMIRAGELVKSVAQIAGGGGGGRPDLAQAGGKNPEKIDEALKAGEKMIISALSAR